MYVCASRREYRLCSVCKREIFGSSSLLHIQHSPIQTSLGTESAEEGRKTSHFCSTECAVIVATCCCTWIQAVIKSLSCKKRKCSLQPNSYSRGGEVRTKVEDRSSPDKCCSTGYNLPGGVAERQQKLSVVPLTRATAPKTLALKAKAAL